MEAVLLHQSEGVALIGTETGEILFIPAGDYLPPDPHTETPLRAVDITNVSGPWVFDSDEDPDLGRRLVLLRDSNEPMRDWDLVDGLGRIHLVRTWFGHDARLWILYYHKALRLP